MARKRETRYFYYVQCDKCGARSPAMHLESEAKLAAQEAGWWTSLEWNGLGYVTTDLCPGCADQAEGDLQMEDHEEYEEQKRLVSVGMG